MSGSKEQLMIKLSDSLDNFSFSISLEQQNQLIDFVLLIEKWNKAFNLTSVRNVEDMLVKHIFDSMVVSPHLTGTYFIDVGTGPGLPGIPLAILNPTKNFVLLDSLGKRTRFITQSAYSLGLQNIETHLGRVENYHPNQLFDGVLSRAFASLKDMLHWCQHLVNFDGEFLALKGQLAENEFIELPHNMTITDKILLQVPKLNAQRHLIKLKKQHYG